MIDIRHGDCREILRDLPDASVDLVLTDPPYGETACEWDVRVDGWLAELPRVMKPTASLWCFGSMRFFLERASDFSGWKYAQDIVWEKHNGSNSLADRFRRVHELAVQFYPAGRPWSEIYKKPVYSDDAIARSVVRKQKVQHWSKLAGAPYESKTGGNRLLRSVMVCRSEHGQAIHPTQKPTRLLAPLIEYSCPPLGVVLDCFAGSGSTGIASNALGRSAILIERDAGHLANIRERVRMDAPLLRQ
jgi:site-specific DNA-methyltransferase (adenine-specific)